MKLERADSCESSGMNFLEYQNFFHGENEKSHRANNSGQRVTTHNSACALKGLTLCHARHYILVTGALNLHSSKTTHRITKIFTFLKSSNNS